MENKFLLILRTTCFLLLIVASVLCYIPFFITRRYDYIVNLGFFRYSGLLLIVPGAFFVLTAIVSFINKGKGTPAIFFTRSIKKIIGEEPVHLISEGIYSHTRNPMYLGVIMIVTGESLLFENLSLLLYAFLLFIVFHLVITQLEEPHLKKKYGQPYTMFLKKTRRWL